MRKLFARFMVAIALAFAGVAHARLPVPLVNHENVPILPASGQVPTLESVRKAIMAGGMAGGRKWFPTSAADGRMRLTYNVRSHSVSIEVTYSQKAYSLVYADSVNMKHGVDGSGVAVIHPFYNNWVRELRTTIDYEMTRL
jgi:hypothetical protein